jgi:hypothetical protein
MRLLWRHFANCVVVIADRVVEIALAESLVKLKATAPWWPSLRDNASAHYNGNWIEAFWLRRQQCRHRLREMAARQNM